MATFVGAPLRLDPGAASNPFVDNTTPIDDELTAVAIAGASKSLRMLGKLVADEDITQSTSITQLSSAPLATSMLSLAAALYGGLEERDLMSLATVIWRSHLLASPKALFVPAAFLFMQAGERVAGYVHELILGDYERCSRLSVRSADSLDLDRTVLTQTYATRPSSNSPTSLPVASTSSPSLCPTS